jgi:hypothetical protein
LGGIPLSFHCGAVCLCSVERDLQDPHPHLGDRTAGHHVLVVDVVVRCSRGVLRLRLKRGNARLQFRVFCPLRRQDLALLRQQRLQPAVLIRLDVQQRLGGGEMAGVVGLWTGA